ncbi:MAG: NAD(P)-dependent alcohol dehydrogenase [Actinomycetota bacterium]|nr:NAD(P)-dependent alcohol dehydrogenase [Actinomycetota bacterium]
MKAARLHTFHDRLRIEDTPEPKITDPFDVVVKVGAAGLCRTDLHIWEGQFEQAQQQAALSLPYSPGHENAGWVHAVGDGVTHVAPGDPVILHPLITCGLCRACRAGDDMHCASGVFPGLFAEGGFAELIKTGVRSVIKMDPSLHPTDVAPLADAGLTAYHAIKKALPLLYPGTRCVVIGAGGLGHIGIQCLKAMSATEVVVVDTSEAALELARGWGADHVVPVDGRQVEQVKELTGGTGAEVVIDFVGEAGAESWGVEMLRNAGFYYVIGYGGTLQVPTMDIILREISFIGNLVGTYNDLVELMTLAAQSKVKLHTSIYPLDAINDAIDDLNSGRLHGRGVLVP